MRSADSTDSDSSQREAGLSTHARLSGVGHPGLANRQPAEHALGPGRLRLKRTGRDLERTSLAAAAPTCPGMAEHSIVDAAGRMDRAERRLMQAAGRRIIRRTAMVVGALLLVALGLGLAARQQRAECCMRGSWRRTRRKCRRSSASWRATEAGRRKSSAWKKKPICRRRASKAPQLFAGSSINSWLWPPATRRLRRLLSSISIKSAEHLAAVIELLKPEHAAVIPLLWQHVAEFAARRLGERGLAGGQSLGEL